MVGCCCRYGWGVQNSRQKGVHRGFKGDQRPRDVHSFSKYSLSVYYEPGPVHWGYNGEQDRSILYSHGPTSLKYQLRATGHSSSEIIFSMGMEENSTIPFLFP